MLDSHSKTDRLSIEDLLESPAPAPPAAKPVKPESSLVGREKEMEEMARLLSDPSCRILTLVGPGGVGKTHLALQVSQDMKAQYPDGIFFIALAAVRSGEDLSTTVAGSLKVSISGQEDPQKQVANFLREKKALLILDSFEHLLEAADWLPSFKEQAPFVQFLVTSRESLGIRGEKAFHVEGLSCPVNERDEEIEEYGAVKLFLREAKKSHSGFKLAEEDKPALALLCRFLGGFPLGIKMAAAWVKTKPVADILAEIQKNRDFLSQSEENLPERHKSLRAVFEHTWNMLGPNQKETFQRLSVLQDPFSAQAAEAVAGATATQLALLVDKSVIRRTGPDQYEMHTLLRQYAQEKLEKDPSTHSDIRGKHCVYFSVFLGIREEWLHGSRQNEAMEGIALAIHDIQEAWDWCLQREWLEEIHKFVEPLCQYFDIRGFYGDGEKTFGQGATALDAILKKKGDGGSKEQQALYGDLLARRAYFIYRRGRYNEAVPLFRESLKLLEKTGTVRQRVFALNYTSFVVSLASGDFKECKSLLEEAVQASEKEGLKSELALSLRHLGYMHWRTGDNTKARQLLHRSENLYTELEDAQCLSMVLSETVNLAFEQSRYEEAKELGLRSLQALKEIGSRGGDAWARGKLGNIHWALGEFSTAQTLYEQSLKVFQDTGDREGTAWAQNSRGHVLKSLGKNQAALESYKAGGGAIYKDLAHQWGMAWSKSNQGKLAATFGGLDVAETLLKEGLGIFRGIANPWGTAYALDGLGLIAGRRGQWKQAEEFYLEALDLAKKGGNPREMGLAECNLGETYLALGDKYKTWENLTAALKIINDISALPALLQVVAAFCFLVDSLGRTETSLACGLFIQNHACTEWEIKEKLKGAIQKWSQTVGPEKVKALQEEAKGLQIKDVVAGLLQQAG